MMEIQHSVKGIRQRAACDKSDAGARYCILLNEVYYCKHTVQHKQAHTISCLHLFYNDSVMMAVRSRNAGTPIAQYQTVQA
jgi:hypothetical protein